MELRESLKKLWHFIWYDDSLASWLVNLILAFVLVKFVIYPAIGLILSTQFPIVAVVSGSMEHNGLDFDSWWNQNKDWYEERDISKEEFLEFRYMNGFNKGDIMFLKGVKPKDIKVGDVLVYETPFHSNPIIHRIVGIGDKEFITKGDNNHREDPSVVAEQFERTGKAVLRLPLLGWVKIWFVDMFVR